MPTETTINSDIAHRLLGAQENPCTEPRVHDGYTPVAFVHGEGQVPAPTDIEDQIVLEPVVARQVLTTTYDRIEGS
ncbi:hypothetical protein [Nocardiopsis synnemataformans]|uniref:hypothetical protein n=1 Tax=Nocardiopsis synnemataformans TaxID=61305 RepID=UPI003EC07738